MSGAMVVIAVTMVPTQTTNITGFLIMIRGFSLMKGIPESLLSRGQRYQPWHHVAVRGEVPQQVDAVYYPAVFNEVISLLSSCELKGFSYRS